jgi:esterase/lipase superfamily enzyme
MERNLKGAISCGSVMAERANWLILAALLLLTACSAQPTDVSRHGQAQVEIAALKSELATNKAALDAARQALEQERQRVADIEARLEAMRRQAGSSSARVNAIETELHAARAAASRAAERSRQSAQRTQELERDLARQFQDYQALLDSLEPAAGSTAPEGLNPARVADTTLVVETDVSPSVVKRVYYATNRNALTRHGSDYWKPFLLPAVALLLGLTILFLIRRYIKDQYQRRFRTITAVVLGIVVLLTLGRGLQQSLQMMQRDRNLSTQYGNEIRSVEQDKTPYQRGYVDVSIPNKRKIGEVPRPQLIHFELVVDATRHFQLASIQPADRDEFYARLRGAIESDPGKSAFVFVHGFHNTFEDAAFRTAQIAHDMNFTGAPIFFSWPSQGAVLDYLTDAKNVETTALHLRAFLEELHRESGATRIHLLAHSMGSRALAQAVEDMHGRFPEGNNFGQLVFAAPDIARDLLEQKILALAQVTRGVTLYASAHDSALRLSRALQGESEQSYQRAGETYPAPMVAPPMQTVDVSEASTGHSYISDSPLMLSDLAGLLGGSRVLSEQSENYVPAGYWLLLPATP